MSDEPPIGFRISPPAGGAAWQQPDGTLSAGSGPDLKTYTWVVHGLYAAGLVTGFTAVAGVIVAYLKRADTVGTIYESHFTYAIRTFWIGLGLMLAGFLLSVILVGVLVFILAGLWWLVRIIRPVMALLENRPIANPTGFL